jgi:hypothetical protein
MLSLERARIIFLLTTFASEGGPFLFFFLPLSHERAMHKRLPAFSLAQLRCIIEHLAEVST